jgi:hypothetical protein
MNMLGRQLPSLLREPIRREFVVSGTAILARPLARHAA